MFGRVGASGASGGAPRADIRKRHSAPLLSESHSHGFPHVAFNEALVRGRGWPVERSATQSSIPVSRTTAYER